MVSSRIKSDFTVELTLMFLEEHVLGLFEQSVIVVEQVDMSLVDHEIVRLVDDPVDSRGIFCNPSNDLGHLRDLFVELAVHLMDKSLIEVDRAVVDVVPDVLRVQEHFIEAPDAFVQVHFLQPQHSVDVVLHLPQPLLYYGLQRSPYV